MPRQISKKIFIYLFLFFTLGTFFNKDIILNDFKKKFTINNLSKFDEKKIIDELSSIQNQNLFFLKKDKVLELIEPYKVIEKSFFFKNYPSNLNIEIQRTKFLAITKKNGVDFFIGKNGNLIKLNDKNKDLPFIFGEVEIEEFLRLKKIIDKSNFKYSDIKNLYYFKSKRWDIETKNGLIINLPNERLDYSFKILTKILEDNKPKHIDLRQKNQVIFNG